jgi:hypothetical protein
MIPMRIRFALDRYAARCLNLVLVVPRIAVLGTRSAPKDAGDQPRVLPGYQGQRLWLVGISLAAAWALWPGRVLSHNPTTTTVLFNREIAAVLQRKCLQCHSAGRMAMSLATYAEARPWAVAIKEEILARRMPPWPAERGYGEFANDLGLTTREIDFLVSWVEGGAPSGVGDPPPFVSHEGHWMLGTPDLVLTPKQGTTVPAESVAEIRRVIVDPGVVGAERWIRAWDFQPGDPRVVRAAFLTVVQTGQYVGGWTTWSPPAALPEGVAFRLPARSQIAVDILYRGTSEAAVDKPSLALYASTRRPARLASSLVLRSAALPAAAGRLRARTVLPSDTTIAALRPELVAEGRSIEVKARRPDGSTDVLLYVRSFRKDWQTPYVLRHPLTLPKGSVVEASAEIGAPGSPLRPFSVTLTTYPPASSSNASPVHHH